MSHEKILPINNERIGSASVEVYNDGEISVKIDGKPEGAGGRDLLSADYESDDMVDNFEKDFDKQTENEFDKLQRDIRIDDSYKDYNRRTSRNDNKTKKPQRENYFSKN